MKVEIPNVKLLLNCFPSITPKLYETKDYTILNTYNHDVNAYTQGLEFYNGVLLEGTGQNGESTLRKTDYKTGKVSKISSINSRIFWRRNYRFQWKNLPINMEK